MAKRWLSPLHQREVGLAAFWLGDMGVHRADAAVGGGRIAAEMILRAVGQPLKRQLEVKRQRHYHFFTSPEFLWPYLFQSLVP